MRDDLPLPIRIFLWILTALAASTSVSAEESILALTNTNTLLRFSTASPFRIEERMPITGLVEGERLIGFDFRPCLCGLYAIGSSNRVYAINSATGMALPVATNSFVPPLIGATFALDFNPVTEQTRIISAEGRVVSVNPILGDGSGVFPPVAYQSGEPAPRLAGLAYSNNLPESRRTTLFGIDAGRGDLVIIDNPEELSGSATFTPVRSVGSLGVDLQSVDGFDITSVPSDTAYALLTLKDQPTPRLFTVNLASGRATDIGTIATQEKIIDAAIALAGTLRFSSQSYSVSQTAGVITLTIQRVGSSFGNVSAEFSTVSGTAVAGTNFTPTSGKLSFPEGRSSATITIPILPDRSGGERAFTVSLFNPVGGVVLDPAATITIRPDTPSGNNSSVTVAGSGSIITSVTTSGRHPITKLRSGIKETITCATECSASAQITIDPRTARKLKIKLSGGEAIIASGKLPIGAAGMRELTLKGGQGTVQRLSASRSSVRATVRTTASNAIGVNESVTHRVTLTRAKTRR